MSNEPKLEGFSCSTRRDGQTKDAVKNIWFTSDFVINSVDESMAEAMNKTSADYPPEVDEFREAGLTPVNADIVKSPMVGESAINVECKVVQILEFGGFPRISRFIIGEVLMVHVKDEYLINGRIDNSKLKSIGRLGYELYCRTSDVFEMKREFVV